MQPALGYAILIVLACYSAWLVGMNCLALWGPSLSRRRPGAYPGAPKQRHRSNS